MGVASFRATVLKVNDLSLLVPGKSGEIALLADVSVAIPPGQFVAVVGPSGCGKSTLLKLIAGITPATFGEVIWNGRDLEKEGDFAPHEIGYVPQFSIAYELLTVEENLDATLRLRIAGLSKEERQERTAMLLQQVGLEGIGDRPVRVLSGGQRRRLALALELATSPELLLCDEVTSGLDPKAEDELVLLLRKLCQEQQRTVISVTHSLAHLSAYDSVIVLVSGQLAYHGSPEHLNHYFQISEPAALYPQLGCRNPQDWHRSWKKHGKAFTPEVKEPESAKEPEKQDKEEEKTDGQNTEAAPAPSAPRLPGVFSQFCTLLSRRWQLFFRDPSALWLQVALILGFPCLVVIFALDGLPQVQNLSLQHSQNLLATLKENADFLLQATRTGSLVSGLVMFQVILLTLMASNNGAREIAGERLVLEKEKFGGLSPLAYIGSKGVFLLTLVVVQSLWMTLFVRAICHFPGDPMAQFLILALTNGAMTAVCLAISALSRTAEQASLISIYLVGFQLPLSGAVLALPKLLEPAAQPFIAAYWGWSGYLQTLKETRLYDVVTAVSQTSLSPALICTWVLFCHIAVGLFVAAIGVHRSRWPE